MFCGECGAKNKKSDLFCCECGKPLKKEEKVKVKKDVKTVEENKSKKKPNVLLIFIIIVVAVVGVCYKIGSDITSPKYIAKKYISALINNDADTLYGYLELKGDKTFISKKIFKDAVSKVSKTNIENYKVTDVNKNDLTATVKYVYTVKGSTTESTGYVSLVKDRGNKYLLFDNWKVGDIYTSSLILENFTIRVAKDSKLTFAGVSVKGKYLDKNKSSKEYDVYVLPQVFKQETDVKVKLPSGIEIEDKVVPTDYNNSVIIKFDKNNISESMKKSIIKTSKEGLSHIYDCSIDMLEFDKIVNYFKHDGLDLTTLENSFSDFKTSLLNSTNKLTSITFKDADIYDLVVDNDNSFRVKLRLNYDYDVEYTDYSGNKKTTSKSTYGYMTVVLKYVDNEFYMYDIKDLTTYFSRY